MTTYVILLRGVMPVGKNKVPMALLRAALEKAGFSGVRTYIQSGNVVVRSRRTAAQIERLVHDVIKKEFGGDVAVVCRTRDDFEALAKAHPFGNAPTETLYFTLLASLPDPSRVKELLAIDFRPDRFKVDGQIVYLRCATRYNETKLNNNYLERKLRVVATTRNYNTMRALIELSSSEV